MSSQEELQFYAQIAREKELYHDKLFEDALNALEIEGHGIKDFTRKLFRRVHNVFSNAISEDVEDFTKDYGNWNVTAYEIHRSVIDAIAHKTLDYVADYPFDKLYHLYIILKIEKDNKEMYLLTEKRPTIRIKKVMNFTPMEDGTNIIDLVREPITLKNLFLKVKEIFKGDFTKYDPNKNNCQRYVRTIVNALGVTKYDSFIEQDTSDIPEHAFAISKKITDLAHVGYRIFGGKNSLKTKTI